MENLYAPCSYRNNFRTPLPKRMMRVLHLAPATAILVCATLPLHLAAIGEEFGMKEFASSKECKAYRAKNPLVK
jgi:hypothetical protein